MSTTYEELEVLKKKADYLFEELRCAQTTLAELDLALDDEHTRCVVQHKQIDVYKCDVAKARDLASEVLSTHKAESAPITELMAILVDEIKQLRG